MKAVMISIEPKWCKLIASGEKTIEVRKTKPKIAPPFKCYIYCTKGTLLYEDFPNGKESREIKLADYRYIRQLHSLNGKVIGEFLCDDIEHFSIDEKYNNLSLTRISKLSGVSVPDMQEYAAIKYSLNAWHISDLVIYDKPRELREFRVICKQNSCDEHCLFAEWERADNGEIFYDCKHAGYIPLIRPPQSWCYVEEI